MALFLILSCPIRKTLMVDPVIHTKNGVTYERSAIEERFPSSGIEPPILVPNRTVKDLVAIILSGNGLFDQKLLTRDLKVAYKEAAERGNISAMVASARHLNEPWVDKHAFLKAAHEAGDKEGSFFYAKLILDENGVSLHDTNLTCEPIQDAIKIMLSTVGFLSVRETNQALLWGAAYKKNQGNVAEAVGMLTSFRSPLDFDGELLLRQMTTPIIVPWLKTKEADHPAASYFLSKELFATGASKEALAALSVASDRGYRPAMIDYTALMSLLPKEMDTVNQSKRRRTEEVMPVCSSCNQEINETAKGRICDNHMCRAPYHDACAPPLGEDAFGGDPWFCPQCSKAAVVPAVL